MYKVFHWKPSECFSLHITTRRQFGRLAHPLTRFGLTTRRSKTNFEPFSFVNTLSMKRQIYSSGKHLASSFDGSSSSFVSWLTSWPWRPYESRPVVLHRNTCDSLRVSTTHNHDRLTGQNLRWSTGVYDETCCPAASAHDFHLCQITRGLVRWKKYIHLAVEPVRRSPVVL